MAESEVWPGGSRVCDRVKWRVLLMSHAADQVLPTPAEEDCTAC